MPALESKNGDEHTNSGCIIIIIAIEKIKIKTNCTHKSSTVVASVMKAQQLNSWAFKMPTNHPDLSFPKRR